MDNTVTLYETPSLRRPHVKVLSTEPNRYQAMIFTDPVHYKAADGQYREIDNRLEKGGPDGDCVLSNRKDNPLWLRLYRSDEKNMVSLTDLSGHGLMWHMEGAEAAKPEIVENGTGERQTEDRSDDRGSAAPATVTDAMNVLHGRVTSQLYSEAVYTNIKPGTDLYCALSPYGLKEAVKTFQRNNHLLVDGIVGKETKARLWKCGELCLEDQGVTFPNG